MKLQSKHADSIQVALLCVAVALLLLAPALRAQSPALPTPLPDNSELTQIYNEDQRIREARPLTPEEKTSITRTDADRLAAVKQMIAKDQLQTKADFRHAAFIVQHSLVSSDYLLAHTLAVICAADGDKACIWLSAASLDRYLQSIKQPQIYGTQFFGSGHAPITQQPYADDLISDSLRKKLGVPSREDQKRQLDNMNSQATPSFPGVAPQFQPSTPK
jgi:hypothetical protein